MPSEANAARAKKLLPCLSICGLQLDSRHYDKCPWRFRRRVAAALDAAEKRGRESAEAELRRLRERIERAAEANERVAGEAASMWDDSPAERMHSQTARVLRSLLTAPQAREEE